MIRRPYKKRSVEGDRELHLFSRNGTLPTRKLVGKRVDSRDHRIGGRESGLSISLNDWN